MEFSSFVPSRATDRRRTYNTSPFLATSAPQPPQNSPRNPFLGDPLPTPDPNPPQIPANNQTHMNNANFGENNAPVTAPVGPRYYTDPRDGIRHSTPPTPPTSPTPIVTPPTPTLVPPNPMDIGAQIYQAQRNAEYLGQRVLEYYGNPQIRNIRVVVGMQIHSVTPYGVLITENGPTIQRTFIPWHRVHDLKFAPNDPLINTLTR